MTNHAAYLVWVEVFPEPLVLAKIPACMSPPVASAFVLSTYIPYPLPNEPLTVPYSP